MSDATATSSEPTRQAMTYARTETQGTKLSTLIYLKSYALCIMHHTLYIIHPGQGGQTLF